LSVAAADGAQDGRRSPAAVVVVGEDVVEVVAAPARADAEDVRPLAVAVLELGLGLVGGLLLLVRVALLGEAEVDESTVPRIADGHTRERVDRYGRFSAGYPPPFRRTALCRAARSSRPPGRRRGSPGTCP